MRRKRRRLPAGNSFMILKYPFYIMLCSKYAWYFENIVGVNENSPRNDLEIKLEMSWK